MDAVLGRGVGCWFCWLDVIEPFFQQDECFMGGATGDAFHHLDEQSGDSGTGVVFVAPSGFLDRGICIDAAPTSKT